MPTLSVRDLEMHYLERGEGEHTAIVMHPATVTGVEMTWLAPLLEDFDMTAYFPDQRGHGRTEGPVPDLHLPRLVDDLLEYIHALGRAPIHGIGFSMGGGVLLGAAVQKPSLFKSLVIMGSSYKPPSQERVDRVAKPVEQRSPIARKVFDPEIGFIASWGIERAEFRQLIAPTLLILGDRDEFVDASENAELYSWLPNAELCVVPNAGHFDMVRHPIVMEAISDFYRRRMHIR